MKALFGVVSMLVALAIVGLVAVKQLRAVGRAGVPADASANGASAAAVPALSGSGSVVQQADQLEHRVAADAVKAMTQGAAAHDEASQK
jgi:hypothetical protein